MVIENDDLYNTRKKGPKSLVISRTSLLFQSLGRQGIGRGDLCVRVAFGFLRIGRDALPAVGIVPLDSFKPAGSLDILTFTLIQGPAFKFRCCALKLFLNLDINFPNLTILYTSYTYRPH